LALLAINKNMNPLYVTTAILPISLAATEICLNGEPSRHPCERHRQVTTLVEDRIFDTALVEERSNYSLVGYSKSNQLSLLVGCLARGTFSTPLTRILDFGQY
jgi:hypothetical protein